MTAVVMTLRDGRRDVRVFASRFQAELFLYYLPYGALVDVELAFVASARIEGMRVVDSNHHGSINAN